MARRTLALKREALIELATTDLALVAGGAVPATPVTCLLEQCIEQISDRVSCNPSCGHSGCCTIDNC